MYYSSKKVIGQVQLVRSLALALALMSIAATGMAQLQVAVLRGIVIDGRKQLVADARVVLADFQGRPISARLTGADGAFFIADVAPGEYRLRVELQGAVVFVQPLVVSGSLPVDLVLQIGASVHEDVVVRGDAAPITAEQPASLGADSVRQAGGAMPGHRIQRALSTLAGFSTEDNGLLHVRGVDDGLLYVQDGIPVYERVDRLFGIPPSASAVASVHVLDGYIPPEFGFKSGGVVEVRSQTGLGGPWSGSVDVGIADLRTRTFEAAASGPIGQTAGLMVTGSHERSSRYLDPVDPGNLHNDGWGAAGSAQFTWHTTADLITGTVQAGQTRYDVPNDFDQDEAGQDQRQRMTQALASATWQRVMSDRLVWQTSLYRRHGFAALRPSGFDTPVTSTSRRRGDRGGGLASATYQRGPHTAKAGAEVSALMLDEQFSFAVTDPGRAGALALTDEAIAHDLSSPFAFADRARPSVWSVFAQDVYRASERVTVNAGVRFDRTRLLIPASQWSPRLGVAYRALPGTVLRGSVLRLFQPPQSEYLLLGSSAAARALSPVASTRGGGSTVPPERQTAIDVSLSQDVGSRARVHASLWRRRARDVGDPNLFFGTTVMVPNSVARQRAWGYEARIDIEPQHGWSGGVSYSHTHVDQFGPVTGGLFLEEDVAQIEEGTRFTPDHEQRHALAASLAFADGRGRWRIAGALRFQTGTPVGLDELPIEALRERRGSEVVDFESGRVRPHATADVQAEWTFVRGDRVSLAWTTWVENLTNELFAYNFGNAFSGTHFGPRRRGGVGVRTLLR